MAYSDPAAGTTVTAAMWAEQSSYGVPICVAKAIDTGRTSDATSTADPELAIVLPANRTYEVEAVLHYSSAANAAGDFRTAVGWTNTATVTVAAFGLNAAGLASGSIGDLEAVAQAADATSPTGDISYGASTTRNTVVRWFRVVTGGSNVTFSLLWGQQTSNVNATTLLTGSSLTGRRANV